MSTTATPTTGAIVFTDIVGFTELTNVEGDDVALHLLDRQDDLVRRALPQSGRVMKELGDGLLLWFDDPTAAVETCLALQLRFEEESADGVPLWVRIGMHWGRPRRRGDDIIGRDVNLAARIADLAGPGEVLCSEATVVAAGEVPGVRYHPLGPVVVKGFDEPVPLVRAVAEG
ncbi:MAG: adenylate/guanylate cyclase domain-containing protein [Acidimicrobiales bacterium]|nr:adenylate/guanylate cyclase domain-containing protein [Acidimicrobiales bacterium]